MLVESDPHETRVAVLEEDLLTEIYLERRYHRGVVGNVYKGRVSRVLPGMQAAFVDIGLERDAFLYVADVYLPSESDASARGRRGLGRRGGDRSRAEHPRRRHALRRCPSSPSTAPGPTIDSLLKVGQELLVQVTKDPLPNKGARVTTQVTFPGRFVVFLPTVLARRGLAQDRGRSRATPPARASRVAPARPRRSGCIGRGDRAHRRRRPER